MNDILNKSNDASARRGLQAGSNKLEILLFSLGTDEVFGINVFKIREVSPCPKITRMPNMPRGVRGVFSLRGNVIPALDLASFTGLGSSDAAPEKGMIVTEYNQSTQGFIVASIDKIIRVDWDQVRAPKAILAGGDCKITAITELEDGRLISILDVEQVLFDAFGNTDTSSLHEWTRPEGLELLGMAFFADDSGIARRRISEVLDHLGVRHQSAENGREAWERLDALANGAQARGVPLSDELGMILTDAEMPEIDGYVLTKMIKSDGRFAGIPVIMHSSLSSQANKAMGEAVGADGYVAKFDPHSLAEAISSRWKR